MPVLLVPIGEGEFPAFFDAVAASHAGDNVAAGRWSAAEAPALAREETRRLLPADEKTPGHHLFVLRDTGLDAEIGYLWFSSTTRAGHSLAFLCQIYIHPPLRRQGHGRRAMQAFEQEARARGHDWVGLHVFATNEHAHRLYQALGYRATSITMHKALGADGA